MAGSCSCILLLAAMATGVSEASAQPIAATRIAAGYQHACSITTGGGVQCWGNNGAGTLGDGTTTHRYTPIAVSGLTGVVAITAGREHTCALVADGSVKCWGANLRGQLGDGTFTQQKTPVLVNGLATGIAKIAAGPYHTCAITVGGATKCWGGNVSGQLGDGTNTDRGIPTGVVGLSAGVSAIALGADHTCAVGPGGAVLCWGANAIGTLGDGTNSGSNTPVGVSGYASGALSVAAGVEHTCALSGGGGVKCWGSGTNGQLGDGTAAPQNTPVAVTGLGSGVTTIAAGGYDSCALTTSGGIKCWGYNVNGELGDGSTTQRNIPVSVNGLTSTAAAIAVGGGFFTCAVTTVGTVQCWGNNGFGQLGDNTFTARSTPGIVNGIVTIAAGFRHTCSLSAGGGVQCWGDNSSGELGDGTNTPSDTPVRVSGLASGVKAIAVGRLHTCALTNAGGVQCWGGNFAGQLGDGSNTSSNMPGTVSGLAGGVTAIAAGDNHTCAMTSGGAVKCWGYNPYGQVGDSSTLNRTVPVPVTGLTSGIASIAAGGYHTCAVTLAGALQCWGANFYGHLGDNSTVTRTAPVAVVGMTSGVASAALGLYHTCVRTTAGAVRCWGANYRGQLGRGTFDSFANFAPATVNGMASGISAISARENHTCAVTTTGAVLCWGQGGYGELGDGTGADRTAPVAVSGLTGITAIGTGEAHSCARRSDGSVSCWGRNDYGQLGDGTHGFSRIPVATLQSSESPFQIIRFALQPGGGIADGYLYPGLNASSGLAVNLVSNTPGICEVLGTDIRPLAEGVCSVTASQPGDNNFFPATDVTRTILIHPATPTISAGLDHNLVIDVANYGDTYAWGGNTGAKLGNFATANSSIPVYAYAPRATTVAAGMSHSLEVTTTGNVWAWGLNQNDQLGIGLSAPYTCAVPGENVFPCAKEGVQVPGLDGMIAVGAGWGHSVALKGDGTVWTWGGKSSPWNELGRSTGTVPSHAPGKVDLSALTSLPIVEIAVGYFHVVARKSDGTLIAWGRGEFGELGNGISSPNYSSFPVNVIGLTDVVAISARGSHTLARKSDGTLWVWGWNGYGQIGDGTHTTSGSNQNRSIPYQVMSGVADMSAGYGFSLVRKTNGSVWAWGLNKSGQLGVATTDLCGLNSNRACSRSPRQLPAQAIPVTGVAAGGAHIILIRSDNSLVLFGDNASGQLGNKAGNFGIQFTQDIYDPDFGLTPLGVYGSGMSVGVTSSSGGLNLQDLGNGFTFPLQAVTVESPEIQVTLANILLAPTAIGSIAISANGDFAIKGHNCGASLPAASQCTIRIVFTPTGTGERNGSFIIASDLADSPTMSFNLTGFGADAPSAPTIDSVIPGNGQVTLNFTGSLNDGGSPILQYVAMCGAFTAPGGADSASLTVTGLTNGATYTCSVTASNAIGSRTSLTASATPVAPTTYTVTPSAVANGSISPNVAQIVSASTIIVFTVTPGAGYHAMVTGCGGALAGNTYTTAAIAGNCAVVATFVLNTYTVTPSAGANGSISPSGAQTVNHGAMTVFTITPSAGYSAHVTGCGGSLVGATYTTGAITGPCAVLATFTLNTYTVTPSAGLNGAISSSTPVTISHGATATFTVTPNMGYTAVMGGTCGGTLLGNIFTTNAITANCTVDATFSAGTNLVAVQSRKSHAGVERDLLIERNPVNGAVTVEPRSVGAGHRIVFQFGQPVTQLGGATAVDNNLQPFGIVFATFSGTEVTVHLLGAPDNRRVTISVTDVNGTGAAAVSLGFLMGDVNGSRSVNAADVAAIKSRVGTAAVDGTNFQYDLNGSGQITANDLTAVRARAGMVLP